MDSNTVGTLIYFGVALVVAIIFATIKRCNYWSFDIGDALLSMLFGVVWPLTIVAGVVYLASGFLCRIIEARKEK